MVGQSSTLFGEAPGIHRTEKEARLPWRFHGYYMDTIWILDDTTMMPSKLCWLSRGKGGQTIPGSRICTQSRTRRHAHGFSQSSCYSTRHLTSFNPGRMIFHYIITYLPLLLLNFWITYPIWGHISTWNRTTPKSSKILERFWAHIRAHLFSTYWLNSVRLLLISAARAYMMDSSAASSPRIIKNHQDDLSSEEHLPTTSFYRPLTSLGPTRLASQHSFGRDLVSEERHEPNREKRLVSSGWGTMDLDLGSSLSPGKHVINDIPVDVDRMCDVNRLGEPLGQLWCARPLCERAANAIVELRREKIAHSDTDALSGWDALPISRKLSWLRTMFVLLNGHNWWDFCP